MPVRGRIYISDFPEMKVIKFEKLLHTAQSRSGGQRRARALASCAYVPRPWCNTNQPNPKDQPTNLPILLNELATRDSGS